MYPYAEDILRDILTGVVEESSRDKCSSQVISASDCCGFFIQESPISPEQDVAALLFPGPDQLSNIKILTYKFSSYPHIKSLLFIYLHT